MKIAIAKLNQHPAAPLLKSLLFIIIFIGIAMLSGKLPSFIPGMKSQLTSSAVACLIALLTVQLFKPKDKPAFATIGLIWQPKTPLRLIYGLLIGTAIFMAILIALLTFTPLKLTYNLPYFNPQALLTYATLIPLAMIEEIAFRSYPQITLNKAYGIWVSQFVVAFCFGLCHVVYGWSAMSAFSGPFVWGFVFGLAALWSGGIAMPVGIHLVLNVLQNIFGFKGADGAVWKIGYPPATTQAAMQQTEIVGLILQAVVLIGALAATAWFRQRAKANNL